MRILAMGALLLAAIAARAQAPAPSDDEMARDHFLVGRSEYDRGDYTKALEEFERSYQLSRRPGLLYNIARCHDKLGQRALAIDAYERYIVAAPEATDRADAKARIDALRANVPAPPAVAARASEPAVELHATSDRLTESPAQPRPVWKRGWFWGVVASGAAIVIAGVVIGVTVGQPATPRTLPDLTAQ